MKHNRIIISAIVTAIFCVSSAQASGFDPFQPIDKSKQAGPSNPNFNSKSSAPAVTPSDETGGGAFSVKLSNADNEKIEECRAQAAKKGVDITQVRFASGLMNIPYEDPNCTRLVIEKMYIGMQVAIRDNPEALAEFQRTPELQNRMEELRKAITILGPSNPRDPMLPKANPYVRKPVSTGEVFKTPSTTTTSTSYENTPAIVEEGPTYSGSYIAPEYWAKNYGSRDAAESTARAEARKSVYMRDQSPEKGASILLDTIQNAQKGQAQNIESGQTRMKSYRNTTRQ